LWGLCAGVCIATDVELWKKKSFSLLSMVDKTKGQVVGYIHLYEAEENGQKVLTIPGIEPSAELLGEVKARDLYPDMIAAIQAVAKQGGYQEIYLPVSETILSNRSDIQKLAKKAGYEKKILDIEVEWNTKPSAYPFKEVYVIPMEQKTDSAIFSSEKTVNTKLETSSDVGGIDMNPNKLNIETKGAGVDLNIPLDPKNLKSMQIEGFTPVIIQIIPTNLPLLLGVADTDKEEQLSLIQ
ncbi:MAG: hypothetical protein KBD53_11815, partial [Candidatus Omnitrophica bacterium]|nr:hypothetical protein [Candidatus Omnitrophota bacterium]